MEKIKTICKKLLNPGIAVVMSGIPITVALMVYVFVLGHEGEAVSYFAYVISAYALTVLCVWVAKRSKRFAGFVEKTLRKNKYADRYLSDAAFQSWVSLYVAAALNILYAVLKLGMGMYLRSAWFITLAVYYGFLIFARILLLRNVTVDDLGKNLPMEFKRYRICAAILLLMNVTLSGMVILVIRRHEGFRYPGMLVYVVAMYDFYIMITAVINVFKIRKHGSPILSASRTVNFAAALIAILSLETAMITEFGSAEDTTFKTVMVAATGGGVSAIFIATAVYMLVQSAKEGQKFV